MVHLWQCKIFFQSNLSCCLYSRSVILQANLWTVSFASAARTILEAPARVLTPIFTCCYSKATSRWALGMNLSWTLDSNSTQRSLHLGSRGLRCRSFTAAAQHGLHLTVTHKPFRAATASPELQLLFSNRSSSSPPPPSHFHLLSLFILNGATNPFTGTHVAW